MNNKPNMIQIKISIIMPFRNAGQYIEKCISSILDQKFTNFELIVVNDNSQDDSEKVCNSFCNVDNRIVLLNNQGYGVVEARNTAIRNARGEYVCFCDADDYVDNEFVGSFVDIINCESPDMIAMGIIKDVKDDRIYEHNHIHCGVYEKVELINMFSKMLHWSGLFEFGINPYLVSKCIRTELARDIMEQTNHHIKEGEDAAIVFPCMLKSKKIVVSDECHYHYISRDDSVTHTRSFDYFENCAILYQDIKKKFENTDYYDIMRPQLDWYIRMLIYIENPNAFEMRTHIFPFGKIEKGSRIVLYGAGNVGNLYEYQVKSQEYARVVLWVDGSWERYSGDGRHIKSPECINNTEFDYVVIAIDNVEIAKHIRTYLLGLGVADTKIVV